jgi:hypothetical protein
MLCHRKQSINPKDTRLGTEALFDGGDDEFSDTKIGKVRKSDRACEKVGFAGRMIK